jgi:hypothetical protein
MPDHSPVEYKVMQFPDDHLEMVSQSPFLEMEHPESKSLGQFENLSLNDALTQLGMKGWKVKQILATPIATEKVEKTDKKDNRVMPEITRVRVLLYTILLEHEKGDLPAER